MERLADDLWRIVFAFAGPAVGARQVAARARTLDEFLKDRLASEPRVDHGTAAARRSQSELDGNRDAPRVTADDSNLADPRASTNKVECGRGPRYSS